MTATSALAGLLRRDRAIVLAALIGVTVIAWTDVLYLAKSMSNMAAMSSTADMPGMQTGSGMMMPMLGPWSGAHFVSMLAMWTVMMIGMMAPSAGPMILIYTQVARNADGRRPFASAFWFAGGYLFAWTGFSVLATLLQWALERWALLTPMMVSDSRVLGGLVLIAAGIYQWLPLKYSCLTQCRSPLSFIMSHGGFRPEASWSIGLGVRHGLYCIGCCWALMALLFVGGVMNLLWIAALMCFVLLEKLLPGARYFSRFSGLLAAAAGVWYLLQ